VKEWSSCGEEKEEEEIFSDLILGAPRKRMSRVNTLLMAL
jgi:hypothetical protein